MSTDWKGLAQARKLDIPEEALQRIAPVLDALEATFDAALQGLAIEVEPALILSEPAIEGK